MLLAGVIQGHGQKTLVFLAEAGLFGVVEIPPHPPVLQVHQEHLLAVGHHLKPGPQGLGRQFFETPGPAFDLSGDRLGLQVPGDLLGQPVMAIRAVQPKDAGGHHPHQQTDNHRPTPAPAARHPAPPCGEFGRAPRKHPGALNSPPAISGLTRPGCSGQQSGLLVVP